MMIHPDHVPEPLRGPGDPVEQFKVSRKIGYPWRFNALSYEWTCTSTFREHVAGLPFVTSERATLEQIRQEMISADKRVLDKGVTHETMKPYLKLLSRHIHAGGSQALFRWPANHFARYAEMVQQVNHALLTLYQSAGLTNWHQTLAAGWACLNAGLVAPALAIWSELELLSRDMHLLRSAIHNCDHKQPRARLSILNGLAATHRLRGDQEAEIKVRWAINDLPLGYYVGVNRQVENLVELYQLGMAEANAYRVHARFINMRREQEPHEPTECVREACLVAWMLWLYTMPKEA